MNSVKESSASTSVQQLHDTTLAANGKRKLIESELPPPSTPPNSTPHFHSSSPEISTRYSPRLLQRMQTENCFRCGQQGHWMCDCPGKSQNLRHEGPNAGNSDILKIYCRCGHGFCEVRQAKSDRNFGKYYYVCPIKRGKKCRDFVGWCSGNVDESFLRPPPYKYPLCPCGAGVCRKVTETGGPNEGRYYFACPIGGGHGACKYHLSEEEALLLGTDADSPSKRMRLICESEFLEGENVVLDGRDKAELSSSPNFHLDLPEFRAFEDPEGVDLLNSVPWDDIEEKARSIIHQSAASRQLEFQRQISANVDSSFDPCPMGWLGRLVFFHPTLGLKFPQPVPFFCCIFPSFNAITVPTQRINHHDHSRESNQLVISNRGELAQLSACSLSVVSRNAVSSNVSLVRERKPMSKEQRQKHIVLNALKDLLQDLESMNPLDHESMRKAAEDTFDLIKLPIDFKEFPNHVWEFINSTSSLAEVQSSIQNGISLEKHIQHYEAEKLRFADIQGSFVKTKTLLEASQKHRQSLREEASRLKEMLRGIESQLTSYEMETNKLEIHLGKINASMLEAEESLKTAAEQVSTAKKLSQDIEAKQLAAKIAFENAKLELEE